MALFLVQQGRSTSDEQDAELTAEGSLEVTRIATVAKGYGVRPNRILHSTHRHAKQTAKLIAEQLHPVDGLVERPGLAPDDDVAAIMRYLEPDDHIMIVSHVPFLERLVSLLVAGDPKLHVIRLQNGGIVSLDRHTDRKNWFIRWALMPQITDR